MRKAADFAALSQEQLAKVHGMTARGIRLWDNEGHPRNRNGTYSAAASIRWRIDRELHDGLNLDGERARLARAQSEKAELDLAVRRGTLLERADVVADGGLLLSAMRARLRGLPARLAPDLSTPETYAKVRQLIATLVDEALLEISHEKFIEALADHAGPADGAATEVDGIGMGGPAPRAQPRGKRRTGAVAHKPR